VATGCSGQLNHIAEQQQGSRHHFSRRPTISLSRRALNGPASTINVFVFARCQKCETRTKEVLSIFVDGEFQAALVFFTPSTKVTPAITSLKSNDPFNDRQLFDALSISL
jgi:hypothetical protein